MILKKRGLFLTFAACLMLLGGAVSCSDVTVTEKELEELPGIAQDRVTTYRINLIPEEFLEQLIENVSTEELTAFLLQWIEEREEAFVETRNFDQLGNLISYDYISSVTDSTYRERFSYSEQFTLVEVETEVNGERCSGCRPDRVERELNILLEPVREEVFQDGMFLYEEQITYNQPGEIFSIRRNVTPGGEELFTEFYTWIQRDQRSSLIRRQTRNFADGERIQITDYGYDPAGYLARVTELEDLPLRVIIAETRYITLEGDRNRNWVLRIRDRQWLEVRRITYY